MLRVAGMTIEQICEILDKIADTSLTLFEVSRQLRASVPEGEDHPLRYLVYALEYLHVNEDHDAFQRYGPFAPSLEMQGMTFPPPLSTLDVEIVSNWAIALEKLRHPALRARLADLLWVRRWGEKPYLFAEHAIDGYMAVSTIHWDRIELTDFLLRALHLSKELNDPERQRLSISQIIEVCKTELASNCPKPGVSLRLIGALIALPSNQIPDQVDSLLELAEETHGGEIWHYETITNLKLKRGVPREEGVRLQKSLVARWIEEANKSDSLLIRTHYLIRAQELARSFGLSEFIELIARYIQQLPEEDYQLKTIATGVEIPATLVEQIIEQVVHDGWRESFTRFGAYGPPCGSYESNVEILKQLERQSPLQFWATRVIYDEHGIPIRQSSSVEENRKIALVQVETIGIKFFSKVIAPAILARIYDKFGLPSREELIQFFRTKIISEEEATDIASALIWYYQGQFVACAYVVVPKIEAIFRNLARELGICIIKAPYGDRPGGFITLGTILDLLNGKIDESWRRYYSNLLANPISLNLRNRICHGLIKEIRPSDAALLLHIVCNLRFLGENMLRIS